MSKKHIAERLRGNSVMPGPKAGETMVDLVIDALKAAIVEHETLRIPGFGTFRRQLRDTRTTRNPRTGELTTKQAHYVIKFREERPRTRK